MLKHRRARVEGTQPHVGIVTRNTQMSDFALIVLLLLSLPVGLVAYSAATAAEQLDRATRTATTNAYISATKRLDGGRN